MEAKNLNGRERNALEFLMAFGNALDGIKALEDRIKSKKDLWRHYRTAQACTEKVINGLLETIPTQQLKNLHHFLNHAECNVRLKPVSSTADYTHVHKDSAVLIITEVIKHTCLDCFKQGDEIKKCKLRKMFDEFGVELPDGGYLCKYATAGFSEELENDR